MANWMNKWQRSPRQDRRVLIDGKFVEQGPVQYPEPSQEEQQESALEVVNEPIVPTAGEENTPMVTGNQSESEKFQEQLESLPISETTTPLLPEVSENVAGENVLDGPIGRVEEIKEDGAGDNDGRGEDASIRG